MKAAGETVMKSTHLWELPTGPLHDHVPIVLHWLKALPQGRGTKYQRERMIESMKGLLDALIRHGSQGGQPLAAASIRNTFTGLQRLVAWMTAHEIWAFRDLRPEDVVIYIKSRQEAINRPMADTTVRNMLTIFRKMWLLRAEYLMPIRFDAALVESEVRRCVPVRRGKSWRPMDEEHALPLVKDALQWVRENGAVVVNLVRSLWRTRKACVGLTKGRRDWRLRRHHAALVQQPEIQRIARQLGGEGWPADSLISRIVMATDGACLVALLFLVGMRASELVRLDADCLEFTDANGPQRRAVLKGFAAKRNGMPRTWAASDDVVQIVQYVQELYADIRGHSGQVALWLNKPAAAPIPLPDRKTPRMTPNLLTKRLRAFAHSPHRGRGGDLYVHPHMGRKTFARFVVMRDKLALESLAYHYGHVHSAITDGHYVGSDIALAKLIREEDRADLAKALMDLLSTGALGGKAGKSMVEAAKSGTANGEHRFRGRRSLQAQADRLIRDGVRLAPCDWGYCVYSKNMSACGGDDSGPNVVRRAPDVCAACENFSVTEKHRPFWNERLRRDEAFLTNPNLPEQTRRIVSTRTEQASEVLRSLIVWNDGKKKVVPK